LLADNGGVVVANGIENMFIATELRQVRKYIGG
jgi:hypothetical protein